MAKQVHPQTIAGLLSKREELIKLHAELLTQTRQVSCDLDHIDAAIKVFDPHTELSKRIATRKKRKDWVQKDHAQRFVLNQLREAPQPLTSRDLAYALLQERGIDPEPGVLLVFRKRLSSALSALQAKGAVVAELGEDGIYKAWRVKPL